MVKAGIDEKVVTVKMKAILYKSLMEKAQRAGFQTTSELLRHLVRQYASADSSKSGNHNRGGASAN